MATESRQSSMKFPVAMAVLTLFVILVGFGYLGARLNTLEGRLESLRVQSATVLQRATTRPGSAACRKVYVPAYSHVYSKGGLPFLLEVTAQHPPQTPRYTYPGGLLRHEGQAPAPIRGGPSAAGALRDDGIRR